MAVLARADATVELEAGPLDVDGAVVGVGVGRGVAAALPAPDLFAASVCILVRFLLTYARNESPCCLNAGQISISGC